MFFCLSFHGAQAQQLLWGTSLEKVRYELFQQPNKVYRFDKSTGTLYDIWLKSTIIRPVEEQEGDLLDGVVKYRLYYDKSNNYYLLNLKTGKVYKCSLDGTSWKSWETFVE